MNVTIVGINSDIGYQLAYRFIAEGWRVQGTYRDKKPDSYLISEGSPFPNSASVGFFQCDLTNHNHIFEAHKHLERWDVMIFASGTMEPIGPFFSLDTFSFNECIKVNLTGPLRFLHQMHKKRSKESTVCFIAGPNPNTENPNYSAYSVSKFALLKACEELDAENQDMKIFSLAPGYVNTKIHQQTYRAGVVNPKLEKYRTGEGTSHDEIFACLRWCIDQPKEVIGGRNIHVQHDPWRGGHLRTSIHSYRMRRA